MGLTISREGLRGCGYFYAYLAGLIDGDGCILIRKREKEKTATDRKRGMSFIVLVKIGGYPPHLKELKDRIGLGQLNICKRGKHLAEWVIAGKQAEYLLSKIVNHLKLKKEQAKIAINMPHPRSRWLATDKMRKTQEMHRLKIQELNRVGRGKL